jgi:hypothetical protein
MFQRWALTSVRTDALFTEKHLPHTHTHTKFTRFFQTLLATTASRFKLISKILMTHFLHNINYIATVPITENCRLILYSPPNIYRVFKSRRMRWVGNIARMERRHVHTGFGWEPDGRRPLRRPRHRWENKIKMVLKEIGWEVIDWGNLTQERASGGLLWTP